MLKVPAGGVSYPLLMALLTQTAGIWGSFALVPIAVVVAPALGLEPVQVGYQISIFFLCVIVLSLFSGAVMSRYSVKAVLQLSMLLLAAGLVLCATAWLPAMVFGTMLIGCCYSLINPASTILLRARAKANRRSLIFSIKQSSVPLGIGLASLTSPLLANALGWRWALAPAAVLALVLCYALIRIDYDDRGRLDSAAVRARIWSEPLHALRAFSANRALMWLAMCGFLYAMVQHAVVTYAGTMFADEYGMPLTLAGLLLGLSQAGAFCGRIGWGQIADASGHPARVMIALGCLMALLVATVGLLGGGAPLAVWIAVMILAGLTAVSWNGVFMSLAAERSRGSDTELQLAGCFFVLFSGGVVGPIVFQALFAAFGSYSSCITAFALGGFAGAACMARSHRKAKA